MHRIKQNKKHNSHMRLKRNMSNTLRKIHMMVERDTFSSNLKLTYLYRIKNLVDALIQEVENDKETNRV